jgi:hypothetical protein
VGGGLVPITRGGLRPPEPPTAYRLPPGGFAPRTPRTREPLQPLRSLPLCSFAVVRKAPETQCSNQVKDSKVTDYRAFARDMMKLCKKHNIKMRADDEGAVLLGPSTAKIAKDYPYSSFIFSPIKAIIGSDGDDEVINVSCDDDVDAGAERTNRKRDRRYSARS